ncbi:MAG: argininosuccinate lyase [Chloroflexota bacterium]|nr:argininosuccinate lyase [Chloroflexota bacterium]MDE2920947.1 argininosuccinate lyase [Chloroflexota bacterium]
MWGGRFDKPPADVARAFTRSFPVDRRMYREDIVASRAHAAMLGRQEIIPVGSANALVDALDALLTDLDQTGGPPLTADDEDVHSYVERELTARIGDDGRRLHVARSRNDQVATDFRLYCKGFCLRLATAVLDLLGVLAQRADEEAETVAPGFTHLQVAQPVTLGHYFLALFEMHRRDVDNILYAYTVSDVCPLGAGALAGLAFDIDRDYVAEELCFSQVARNSLDAVSDRDFVSAVLQACATLSGHLSRWAEDLVIWASPGFGLVRFDDAFATGSSMLPQKLNPDVAELTRAKAGAIAGAAVGWQATLKGVPLSYALDMQEDKRSLFRVEDDVVAALRALTGALRTLTVNRERMAEVASLGHSTAIEIADYLTERGVPFRDAHAAVGRLVRLAEDRGVELADLEEADFVEADERLSGDVRDRLELQRAVARRTSLGGTAPARVREEAARANRWLRWQRDHVQDLTGRGLPLALRPSASAP